MSTEDEQALADWMIVVGALGLLASLFLAWSHQIGPVLRREFAGSVALSGVPASPNAWQVYSAMDVVLAVLAVSLVAVALFGDARPRLVVAAAACVALAFVAHALLAPPTSGLLLVRPGSASEAPAAARYVALHPGAGAGAWVALTGLVVALAGLALSLSSTRARGAKRTAAA